MSSMAISIEKSTRGKPATGYDLPRRVVGNANCRAHSARIGVATVFLTLLLRLMAGRVWRHRIVHDILLASVLFAE